MRLKTIILVLLLLGWATAALSIDYSVSGTLTAAGNATDSIASAPSWQDEDSPWYGYLNLSIDISGNNTVTIQRSLDGGLTWKNVREFSADKETAIQDVGRNVLYRGTILTGDYTDGNATVWIGY